MNSPIIHILSKKGHSKKFDSRATQLTRALYSTQLGGALITKELIRAMNIRHVLWIESADGTPVAATMVFQQREVYFRVGGLAVDDAHKRKGYGSALLGRIDELLPTGSRLLLGVDTGKDATEWLTEWYKRLGFLPIEETHDEIVLGKAILKTE
jgi:predicted GNAT family acetyltransferase